MAKETKSEQAKRLWFYGILAIVALLALELQKGIYAMLLISWGMALSLPISQWMNKTGWRFSRLEWLLMMAYFSIGLTLLLTAWFLYPNQLRLTSRI